MPDLRDRLTGQWIDQQAVNRVKRFDDFTTIDWVEDELINHKNSLLKAKMVKLSHNSFRFKIFSFIQNWLVLSIMGITIGLIAGGLNIITAWLASIRFGYCSSGLYLNKSFCCWNQGEDCKNWSDWSDFLIVNYFLYIIISLLLAFIAATLVRKISPSAAGSGISEIKCIVSGFVMKGFLGWSTLMIKSIGLPLAIGSGLSVGKEGPSVHYAVCVGNSIAKLFNKYRQSASRAREFLTATSAAGVAVAFGSPMGGVLFSMEEISNVFQLPTIFKSYFCSVIAVGTLAMLNPFRTGQLVIFEVVYDTNWYYYEIPVYIILGIFGGVYGIIVSKLNIKVVSFRKRYLSNFVVREVLILTLFTALVCYFNQFLRIDMTESMQILFNECNGIHSEHPICSQDNKISLILSLLFATIVRMGLTIITYGCKVPAGIFVPSMAAGATFGRALGIIMSAIYTHFPDSFIFASCSASSSKCIIPGTYAFLGAAAALSGITHLTVTVVVIMFELTGAIRYIIPTMIVVAITTVINDKWGKGGIADQMIKFNGLPLIDSKEDISYNLASVKSAMSPATIALPMNSGDRPITVGQLKKILQTNDYRGFPLVESEFHAKISGFILRSDIEFLLSTQQMPDDTICNFYKSLIDNQLNFQSVINVCPLTISSSSTLEYVTDMFVKLGPRCMLVEENGLLIGIITRKDVLRYEHTLHSLHHDDDEIDVDFETHVWETLMLFSTNLRKKLGKIIYNDESRFLGSTVGNDIVFTTVITLIIVLIILIPTIIATISIDSTEN